MKKTISTVAAIAVAFAGLAFIPAQKNNAMEDVVVATGEKEKHPGCDYIYKIQRDFSQCQKMHGPSPDETEEVEVLDKY